MQDRLGDIGVHRTAQSANFSMDAITDLYSCTGSITATISDFQAGRQIGFRNDGTGIVTISGTVSGVVNPQILPGQCLWLGYDGSSHFSYNPNISTYNVADTTYTASSARTYFLGVNTQTGVVIDAYGGVRGMGADASNDLSISWDFKKRIKDSTSDVSLCSTNPSIDKSAGAVNTAQSTAVADTGITQAVIQTDGSEDLSRGDTLVLDITLVRTSPSTEFNSAHSTLVVKHW